MISSWNKGLYVCKYLVDLIAFNAHNPEDDYDSKTKLSVIPLSYIIMKRKHRIDRGSEPLFRNITLRLFVLKI